MRTALLTEVVVMAFETVRSNKMRSSLTVLGVVIGITSIVGMTALIRGFDQSLRDLIAQSGPNIIYLQKFGVTSFANGAEISKLLKRPDLTLSDSRALETQNSTLQFSRGSKRTRRSRDGPPRLALRGVGGCGRRDARATARRPQPPAQAVASRCGRCGLAG